jgi:hypothetical protein
MKTVVAATLLAASLAVPATARADCGQDGQPACSGPVPTVDLVTAIVNEVADPNIPAANKNDVVTPPFNDDQAQKFDTMLYFMRIEGELPIGFTVTDIQPAPNNTAGATVSNPPTWVENEGTAPVVLVLQNGRWMITHQTAVGRMAQLYNDKKKRHHAAV